MKTKIFYFDKDGIPLEDILSIWNSMYRTFGGKVEYIRDDKNNITGYKSEIFYMGKEEYTNLYPNHIESLK